MAIRQRKDGRWVVYYRQAGTKKTKEEYFGRGAEGEAAAKKRNRELGLRQYAHKKQASDGFLFYELAKAYAQNKQFSANSKKHLLLRLEANIFPAIGQRVAVDLKHSDLDAYVKKRMKDGVKMSTIAREITDIKAILNWSAKRQPPLIAYNPVRDYPKPTADDAIIFPPTREEIHKILQAAAPHLKRAIHLAYYIGMRPGAAELLSLTWANVNFEAQTIEVLSARKGGPIRRTVDLHPAFVPVVMAWYVEDQKYYKSKKIGSRAIVHFYGKQIKTIKTAWKNALFNAKITRRLRPYDMRHEFVSRAIEGGADIKTISEIVGSSPRTLMQTYQHVSNPMRKQTIANMPGLE